MDCNQYNQIADFLLQEWRNVIHDLPPALRGWMAPPSLAFNPDMREWGRWWGSPRNTLELSTRLLEEHPWYATMEVFKHEIAHQIVQVCYPQDAAAEPPHGSHFQFVCQMIGANPAASGDFPPLDQRVFGENQQETPAIGKLKKLLALANSSNEFEAESALVKAKELAEKYQISLHNGEIADTSEFCSIGLGKIIRRRTIVHSLLGGLLQEHYQVMSIWVPVPMLEEGCIGYQLHIHGRSSAVKIASYIYDWLVRFLEAQKRRPHGQGRNSNRDFAAGILMGFSEALSQKTQHENTEASDQSIIQITGKELLESFHKAYPHIQHRNYGGGSMDADALENGKATGRNLNIPSGIGNSGGAGTKFLK